MWKNVHIACWQAVHEDIGDTSFYSFHDHGMLDVCGLIVLIGNCVDLFLSECVLCSVRADAHEEEIKALIEPCLKFLQRRGQDLPVSWTPTQLLAGEAVAQMSHQMKM